MNETTVVGLLEQGFPASAIFIESNGSLASGALINVGATDIPYTIQLHNFGTTTLEIRNPDNYENTGGSIRVLKFADGPSTT